jgi:hypothetical protein
VPAYSTGLTTNLVKGHSPVAVFTAQRFSSLSRGALRAPTRTDEKALRAAAILFFQEGRAKLAKLLNSKGVPDGCFS